jgi:hypothetical protein
MKDHSVHAIIDPNNNDFTTIIEYFMDKYGPDHTSCIQTAWRKTTTPGNISTSRFPAKAHFWSSSLGFHSEESC